MAAMAPVPDGTPGSGRGGGGKRGWEGTVLTESDPLSAFCSPATSGAESHPTW